MRSLTFTLPLNPVPAVRMTKKTMHYNRQAMRYLAFKEHAAYLIRQAAVKNQVASLKGNVDVVIKFERTGKRRADIDNLSKAILDSLQDSGLIKNDNQVTWLQANVEYGCDNGRIHVTLREAT